jgi:hypothetical protein
MLYPPTHSRLSSSHHQEQVHEPAPSAILRGIPPPEDGEQDVAYEQSEEVQCEPSRVGHVSVSRTAAPYPPLTRQCLGRVRLLTALLRSLIFPTASSLAHAKSTVGREMAVSPRARRRRVP